MFHKSIFGPLLNVNMVFNDQLIYHFLLRQIPEEANANGICFSVLGKNVHFTQNEFNIITGLWPTKVTLEKDFEFTNDEDAVKQGINPSNINTTRKWSIPDAEKHVGIKNVGNKGFPDALNNASRDASGKPSFPTHHEGVGKNTSGKGVFPDAVNSASGAASGIGIFPDAA
ncbi:Ulp1-like peptidase [Cucumis melo var. makuwa]|uniref:Ulp1-like peptidase n=1 Tax=Cucumis melo var. makuwa TaxID=1194695 RepID=A0A5A7TK94_CUCMM|nr:Ulp1-like peptidase [Cucumis melo var. makuwa]TYK27088.1 Ulp1-like peptidase [Cucumis melo var. makuwa]